jgi:hypothetical protein
LIMGHRLYQTPSSITYRPNRYTMIIISTSGLLQFAYSFKMFFLS